MFFFVWGLPYFRFTILNLPLNTVHTASQKFGLCFIFSYLKEFSSISHDFFLNSLVVFECTLIFDIFENVLLCNWFSVSCWYEFNLFHFIKASYVATWVTYHGECLMSIQNNLWSSEAALSVLCLSSVLLIYYCSSLSLFDYYWSVLWEFRLLSHFLLLPLILSIFALCICILYT